MRSKKRIIQILLLLLILTGCKEKTYTVTFDTQGGNTLENIVVNEGESIENIKSPEKEGYLFVSWFKDGMEYDLKNPVTEDISLTARWVETPEIFDYYTVTFITDEKTEKFTVKENESITEQKAPEKENYLFLGWYIGEEKFDFKSQITKDITLIAKYELNVVTITYDLDGGFGLALESIPKNTTVSIPEPPSKLGYKFLKWTLNGKEFSFDTKINKDITLKAVWELIEYVTITFDTDGGNVIEPEKIEKYSRLKTLPTPEKEGYDFINWQLEGEQFTIDNKIENDIILKAIYEPITPTEEEPQEIPNKE